MIAFIGSVFSPWYRWSGRKSPQDHVCINVATYGKGGRFTMTDRGQSALRQSGNCIEVGPSSLTWEGDRLVIRIDEIAGFPRPGRVRGIIELIPEALTDVAVNLTPDGRHGWRPFAPVARISVRLGEGWTWDGHGYFDANFGQAALEADFDHWSWGRYPTPQGTFCFYDATRRDGTVLAEALHFRNDGSATRFDAPPLTPFSRSLWAVRRETRADPGVLPRQVKPMLDAPFYCRSLVRTRIGGAWTTGVHEALDLTRFRVPLLMPMLAMRVPRRRGWTFRA